MVAKLSAVNFTSTLCMQNRLFIFEWHNTYWANKIQHIYFIIAMLSLFSVEYFRLFGFRCVLWWQHVIIYTWYIIINNIDDGARILIYNWNREKSRERKATVATNQHTHTYFWSYNHNNSRKLPLKMHHPRFPHSHVLFYSTEEHVRYNRETDWKKIQIEVYGIP